MLLSKQPKRGVAAFIALIQLSIVCVDFSLDGWIKYYVISSTESLGAILLIFCTKYARNRTDIIYFRLMSAFLLLSALTVPLFRYDLILYHKHYVIAFQIIACAHILIMLLFADGTRNLTRGISDSLHSIGSSLFGLRG